MRRSVASSPDLRLRLGRSARWLVPALVTTVAGCRECPQPVHVFDQPYTATLQGSGITLDATPESWNALCEARCGAGQTACTVHVNTCDCNGPMTWIRCDAGHGDRFNGVSDGFDTGAWVAACEDACGPEQDCQMGVDPAKPDQPTIRCESWYARCTGY